MTLGNVSQSRGAPSAAGGNGEWVGPLPSAVDLIAPPQTLSPSHLGIADECLLRAVLGSVRSVEPLPAHPAADLGTAFHLLLERAVRGEIERRGTAEEDARRELGTLLDDASSRLAARLPVGASADLRAVWPPLVWRRKMRLVLDIAVRYLERDRPTWPARSRSNEDARDSPLDFDALPSTGTWAEVRMRAPTLRIAGRADLVEKTPTGVTIRDLKTGRATDQEGGVRPHVARQLRLYGLMARQQAPGRAIRLVVDDGMEREVSFSTSEANETEEWLLSVLRLIPTGRSVEATRIGRLGPACEGCGFRHVCPVYRRQAAAAWRDGAPHRMPLDVWGTVELREQVADGTCRVRIRDDAGRLVAVSGLRPERLKGVGLGARLHLYGLRTRDRTGGHESARHPLNFFETSADDSHDRAWSLAAFTERTER